MVQVRWAHRGEGPKVFGLFKAIVESEHASPPRPSEFSRTWGRSFRAEEGFRFVVAEGEEKRIIACMSLHRHFSTWKGRPVVSLEDFYVLPGHRGQGVGSAMLAFADAYAQSLGAARIELDVRTDNPRAQDLYKRHGYEEQPYYWYHKPVLTASPRPGPSSRAARRAAEKAPGRRAPPKGPSRRAGRRRG